VTRYLTSHEASEALQVNTSSIVKWTNDGILQSFKTPGGHRRYAVAELIAFAEKHGMPVPEGLRAHGLARVLLVTEPRFASSVEKQAEGSLSIVHVDNWIDALLKLGGEEFRAVGFTVNPPHGTSEKLSARVALVRLQGMKGHEAVLELHKGLGKNGRPL
jgi:hypothetical protein